MEPAISTMLTSRDLTHLPAAFQKKFDASKAIKALDEPQLVAPRSTWTYGTQFLNVRVFELVGFITATGSSFGRFGANGLPLQIMVVLELDMNDASKVTCEGAKVLRVWTDSHGNQQQNIVAFKGLDGFPCSPDPAINLENVQFVWETLQLFRDLEIEDRSRPRMTWGSCPCLRPCSLDAIPIMSTNYYAATEPAVSITQYEIMSLPREVLLLIVDEAVMDSISAWNVHVGKDGEGKSRADYIAEGRQHQWPDHTVDQKRDAVVHTLFCLNKFFFNNARERYWNLVQDHQIKRGCETLLAYKHIFGIPKSEERIVEELEVGGSGSAWRKALPDADRWDCFDMVGDSRCLCGAVEKSLVGFPREFRGKRGISS